MVDKKYEGDERRGASGFVVRFELLGVLLAIIIQTLTAVWWGSAVTTKMDYIQETLKTGALKNYTIDQAIASNERIFDRINRSEERIDILEKKVDKATNHL